MWQDVNPIGSRALPNQAPWGVLPATMKSLVFGATKPIAPCKRGRADIEVDQIFDLVAVVLES